MADDQHADLVGEDIHIPVFATYTNAANRAAGTAVAGGGDASNVVNVGKWARQIDTGAIYQLTDESPITWALVADPNAFSVAGAGLTSSGTTVNVIANADASIVVNANDVQVAAAIQSGAAAGATALQPAGNLTGTVNGVAVATVTSGAAAGANAVPNTRTLTGTAPIQIAGDNSAHDLSANRTLSIVDTAVGTKGAISLGGDLAGSATSQTVAKANGATLPASPGAGDLGKSLIVSAADTFALVASCSYLEWGVNHSGATTAAAYWHAGAYTSNASGTEALSNKLMPVAGKIRRLCVTLEATMATDMAVTVRVNGVDTAATLTITAGNLTATDWTGTVAYALKDKISLKSVTVSSSSVVINGRSSVHILPG